MEGLGLRLRMGLALREGLPLRETLRLALAGLALGSGLSLAGLALKLGLWSGLALTGLGLPLASGLGLAVTLELGLSLIAGDVLGDTAMHKNGTHLVFRSTLILCPEYKCKVTRF